MLPHEFAALDYTLEQLGIVFEGAKIREEKLYDLALWTSYHVGVFCRAAYHSKAYPTWESVSRKWQAGKQPKGKGAEDWRINQDMMKALARRPPKKGKRKE